MTNLNIRSDTFPAIITITPPENSDDPSPTPTTYEKVRVILTLDHIYVFRDSFPNFEIVFEDRLDTYTKPVPGVRLKNPQDRFARFTTEDGYSGQFTKQAACGCGSRLKTASLSKLFPSATSQDSTTLNAQVSKNDS